MTIFVVMLCKNCKGYRQSRLYTLHDGKTVISIICNAVNQGPGVLVIYPANTPLAILKWTMVDS